MKKIVMAINNMDFEELRELQKDIENSSEIVKKALWNRMQDLSNSEKFCATCFKELKNPKYTLIVGDKFKRKLSFCEKDCFKYYLRNLEELREELVH
jgi:hypothetical protein